MWKTVNLDIGQKFGLDAPNDDLKVRVVPLMWLPGKTSKEIMAHLQEEERRVSAAGDDNVAILDIRFNTMLSILPSIVSWWNLKDPATATDVPLPSKMLADNNVSFLQTIPMQILSEIVNTAVDVGFENEPSVVEGGEYTDPDKGDPIAKVIPFENADVSGMPSSEAQLAQIAMPLSGSSNS